MSRISDLAGFTTAISTTEDLSVGIITASSFSGNLTGDVTGTATGLAAGATGSDLTLSGNLSIGGTLTYQDVTNVDAVGMVTARKGLQVLADGLDVTGVGTFKSNVSIADSFIHTGDTDTAIRFPGADTFTVHTNGSERVRVTSDGKVGVGEDSPQQRLHVSSTASTYIQVQNTGDSVNAYYGVDTANAWAGSSTNHPFKLHSNNTERMRITSGGDVIVNGTVAGSSAKFEVQSTTGSLTSATARIDGGKTTTGAVNTGSSLLFAGHDGSNGRDFASLFAGKENGTSGNHNAYLAFGTRVNGGAVTEKLRVTSTGGVHFNNAELIERVNITSGKLSDNQDINLDDGMAHLFTTAETTTATPNIRITTGINTHMAVGDVISVNIITTAAAAGYAATVHIDGVTVGTNGGSLVWNGGSAPSEGGSSGNDFYSYSIIKTASATYTVLANVANFA